MPPYLKCLIFVCIVNLADSLHIEPKDDVMWVKNSRSLTLTCISEWEVSWFKGATLVKSNENVIIHKYRITTGNREQNWSKLVINRAATTDSGNYNCTDGKKQRHIDINVVKGQLRIHPSGRVTVFVGESITMTCLYEGGVKLNVTWYNDVSEQLTSHGFVSSRRTFSNHRVHTTLQSTKESLTLSDTGSYYCIAGPFIREIKLQVLTDVCNERLVSGSRSIPDDLITASSYYRDIIHDDSPHCARLNQTRSTCHGWSPIKANRKQWIQVSFSSFTVIRSIITLGRLGNDSRQEWVKSYRLTYSQDGVNWNKYKDTNGQILEFEANWDKNTEATAKLPIPVVVKFLRIYPESWHNKISLRFDVLGCLLPTQLQITNEDSGKVNLFIPNTLKLTCNYSGPDTPDVAWYKDGVRLLDNSIFINSYNTTWLKDRVRSTVTLKKEITTYGDSGVYTCVDRTSRQNRTVTVHAAQLKMKPVFKRLWMLTNTRLQMSCEYTGTHSKQITWNRNDGKHLQSLGFHITTRTKNEKGTSRTTSTITKENVSMDDGNNITCSGGGLELHVNVIVVSGGEGRPQLLVSGQTTTLTCGVGEVDDKYSFEVYWTKNYIPLNLVESMKGRYKYSSNARLLTIQHADIQDAGHYECNILLEVGTDQQQHLTIPIELNAQPEILIEGHTQIKSGDTLHLYCKVSGYPIPVIEWYRDGQVIVKDHTRTNFLPYGDIPNGHLVLFNVHDTDRGIYECKGSSVRFEPVKSSTFLKVKDEPVPQNVLMICVAVACTVVVLAIICCVLCIKCRSKQNDPVRNDIPLQNKPLLTKRYVDMQVITRRKSKSITSLEEIDRLPPPPPPIDTWEDSSTLEDASLTYERIPRSREMQSV